MSTKRCGFSGDMKARVALAALRGDRTLQEVGAQYQVHPDQVSAWKRQAVQGLADVFSPRGVAKTMRPHRGTLPISDEDRAWINAKPVGEELL